MKTVSAAVAILGATLISSAALASHPRDVQVTFEMQEALERYDFARPVRPPLNARTVLPSGTAQEGRKQAQKPQRPFFDHDSFDHGGGF